jgi:hypothetical protein
VQPHDFDHKMYREGRHCEAATPTKQSMFINILKVFWIASCCVPRSRNDGMTCMQDLRCRMILITKCTGKAVIARRQRRRSNPEFPKY